MELAQHQVRALSEMRAIEASPALCVGDGGATQVHSRIGWYTDPPGAGKTRVIVALAASPPPVPRRFAYSYSAGDMLTVTQERPPPTGTPVATTVVVVPPSIVAQWETELAQAGVAYYPVRLNVHVVAMRQRVEADDLPTVTLVCSTRYGEVREALVGYIPSRLVFDEAPRIKLTAHPIHALFTWLVSATPEEITMHDLVPRTTRTYWSTLRCLPLASLRAVVVRNADATIVYPSAVTEVTHVCLDDSVMLGASRWLVSPSVRARLDANDVQGALAILGGAEGEDLMTAVRRRIASDLEETRLIQQRLTLLLARMTGAAHERTVAQIERCEQRTVRLGRDAINADARFADALQSECIICQSTLEQPVLVPCCQNLFCGACLIAWVRTRADAPCPSCRAPSVRMLRIAVPGEAQAPRAPQPPLDTKSQTVLAIVAAARAGVLVYSANVAGLYTIRNRLEGAGISFSEIQGRSTTRDKALRAFRSGQVKVLLLDAGDNCAGIDLPGVSDIVLYHTMREPTYTQIVGRGKRICRTEPLAIHTLTSEEGE